MKALGMESDQEIFEAIVSEERMGNIVYANIEEIQDKKIYPPNGIFTTEDAIVYLERKFATGQAKEYRVKKVESIIDRSLLPHLGDTPEDRLKKAIFLGRIARSVLELSLDTRKEDDKDHYANKRLKLAGDLMEDLFRVAFTNLMKDLKYQLERSYARKKDLRIASAIRPDLLTHRLLHALATGNWVGGRAGVSQLLDRTSNMSTISHLRRVTSSLTRSQPHFEARDLHPTQWGRLCPNETPEGQNCGLVKNAALIIDVSEGFPEKDVTYILNDLGVKEVKGQQKSDTRVYVNGDLKGVNNPPGTREGNAPEAPHRAALPRDQHPQRRGDRRGHHQLRRGPPAPPPARPYDGRTALTRKQLDDISDGHIRWTDLIREGAIEWVDAEEEEDSFIAVEPYQVPERCEKCGIALSPLDVDWLNMGTTEKHAHLKCRHCGGILQGNSSTTRSRPTWRSTPCAYSGFARGSSRTQSTIPHPVSPWARVWPSSPSDSAPATTG